MNIKRIGLVLGPVLYFLVLLLVHPAGMSPLANATLACALWMAAWWVTEAAPMAATALLPLVLFPFSGVMTVDKAAAPFAEQIIFLFVGGFMMAAAVERWNLHKRIALAILAQMGGRPDRIVLGFMLAASFLSMWLSNTATAIMMVPIALTIIQELEAHSIAEDSDAFAKALLLGIAYACSIGGIATIIGTPTNAIFADEARRQTGVDISFLEWFLFAFPIACVLLAATWFYLVRIAFHLKYDKNQDYQSIKDRIKAQLRQLGKITAEEKGVLAVFSSVILVWIFGSLLADVFPAAKPYLKDSSWAILGAVILFILPSQKRDEEGKRIMLLDWETAEKIPWGVLLLFGGGLSLAEAFKVSGLSLWIGGQVETLAGLPLLVLLLIVVGMVNFLTEVTSNMATASMILPILAGMSVSIGLHPYWLMIGATCAASCAFMLPVATAPNAIVFSANYLRIKDMVRTGFALNILSILLFSLYIYFVLPLIWTV